MKDRLKSILYFASILCSTILFIAAFYIGENKKATDSSAIALKEALRWFQLTNILYNLSIIVFGITVAIWCFDHIKNK
ncbi:hypothetical protein DSECCO2_385860 [anaerobic digester metagenome]